MIRSTSRSRFLIGACCVLLAVAAGRGVWRGAAPPPPAAGPAAVGGLVPLRGETVGPTADQEGAAAVRTPLLQPAPPGRRVQPETVRLADAPKETARTATSAGAGQPSPRSSASSHGPAASQFKPARQPARDLGSSESASRQSQAPAAGQGPAPSENGSGAGAGSTGSTAATGSGEAGSGGVAGDASPAVSVPGVSTGIAPRVVPPRVIKSDGTEYPVDGFRLTVHRQDLGSALSVEGAEGAVGVRALVQADGTAARIEIIATSGSPVLDRAAEAAVRRWLFAPATRDGVPIDAYVTFKIRYVVR